MMQDDRLLAGFVEILPFYKKWQNLGFSSKLKWLLGILVLASLLVAGTGFVQNHQTRGYLRSISSELLPSSLLAQQVIRGFDEQLRLYEDAVLMGDEQLLLSGSRAGDQLGVVLRDLAIPFETTNRAFFSRVFLLREELALFSEHSNWVYLQMIRVREEVSLEQVQDQVMVLGQQASELRVRVLELNASCRQLLDAQLVEIGLLAKRQQRLAGGLMLVVVVFALFVGFVLIPSIIRPLVVLAVEARAIGRGAQPNLLVAHGGDEVADLTRALSQMVRDLHQRESDLDLRNKEVGQLRSYLKNVFNSMPSILVGVDGDGVVSQLNQAALDQLGLPSEKGIGQPFVSVFPCFDVAMELVARAVAAGEQQSELRRMRLVDGEIFYEDIAVYPLLGGDALGAVIRVDDVTERVRIEEMMVQSEKMMSVGELAAGMAHEINNPLGIIVQAVQNVERRISPDLASNEKVAKECSTTLDAVRAYLDKRTIFVMLSDIRQAGQRAAEIVKNMLQYSRCSESYLQYVSIIPIIDKALELAGNDYDLKKKYDFRQIKIIREFAPDLPEMKLVETEIEQVFLNLFKNSAQAMGACSVDRVPTLTLRAKEVEGALVLEVEDNGPGMEEAVRRKVFEPFFTTKPPGLGTGLGLSVSFMIISQNHHGRITVTSAPEQGCCFRIMLPL